GTVPLSPSMDHFGPLTKTVQDNQMVLDALVDHDTAVSGSMYDMTERPNGKHVASAKELIIGIPERICYEMLEQEVRESFDETVRMLQQHGIRIEMFEIDVLEELQSIHQTVLGPEMFSTFEDDIKKFPDQINEEVLSFLTWGAGINTSAYKKALKRKQAAVTSFYHLFKQVDFILTPTISILPTPIHQREINIDGNQQRIDHI